MTQLKNVNNFEKGRIKSGSGNLLGQSPSDFFLTKMTFPYLTWGRGRDQCARTFALPPRQIPWPSCPLPPPSQVIVLASSIM